MPALALIDFLADDDGTAVNANAVERAIRWAGYFESHARRLYAAGGMTATEAAKTIIARIRKGDLTDGFTARDVHQRDWSGLTIAETVQAALDLLVKHKWLKEQMTGTGARGGRPTTKYQINPRMMI